MSLNKSPDNEILSKFFNKFSNPFKKLVSDYNIININICKYL